MPILHPTLVLVFALALNLVLAFTAHAQGRRADAEASHAIAEPARQGRAAGPYADPSAGATPRAGAPRACARAPLARLTHRIVATLTRGQLVSSGLLPVPEHPPKSVPLPAPRARTHDPWLRPLPPVPSAPAPPAASTPVAAGAAPAAPAFASCAF